MNVSPPDGLSLSPDGSAQGASAIPHPVKESNGYRTEVGDRGDARAGDARAGGSWAVTSGGNAARSEVNRVSSRRVLQPGDEALAEPLNFRQVYGRRDGRFIPPPKPVQFSLFEDF
jgi:hypothetical protein